MSDGRFRVVALLAAHNEADVVGSVVRDLVEQGVEVYALDHASTDGTAEALAPFLGQGLLRIERFPEESGFPAADASVFALEHLLRRKEALAAELEADWYVHHDADEFREGFWEGVGLCEALERVDRLGYSAVDFEALHFPPTHDRFRPGDDPRQAFRLWEPDPGQRRPRVQAWKRTSAGVDLRSTGGREARFEGRRVFPFRFLLRHYPFRGQAHGERKVFRERLPRLLEAERSRGWHARHDALAPGHRFLRGEEGLRGYDPVAVRLDLAQRHRGLEESEEARETLRQALETREDEVDRLRVELESLAGRLTALAAQAQAHDRGTEAARAETARVASELHERLVEAKALRAEREARDAERAALEQALVAERARHAALTSSLSWRLTAPLRALGRLLGGDRGRRGAS